MFENFERDGQWLGLSYTAGKTFFFFGGRTVGFDELSKLFPQYQFCQLKQVHGTTIALGDPNQRPNADAVWTDRPGSAIAVQTADCIPILLAEPGRICAVHAGWRGVAQNILKSVDQTLIDFKPTSALLGPHIQTNSFEVGADVAQQLVQAAPPNQNTKQLTTTGPGGRPHVDLNRLVQMQLRALYQNQIEIYACGIDTVTDSRFHSFRRDKGQPGRQFSFVVINP